TSGCPLRSCLRLVAGRFADHHDAPNATIWSSRCSCEPRNGQKSDRIWLVSLFHDAIFPTVRLYAFLCSPPALPDCARRSRVTRGCPRSVVPKVVARRHRGGQALSLSL